MRWRYLIPRFIVVALAWAFLAFACDPLLRHAAVTIGETAAGARVDVGGLETKLFPPTCVFRDVQIADKNDPDTNLVEFSRLEAKLEIGPLLKRSYVVENATVTGLTWDSQRAESGALEPDATGAGSSDFADKLLEYVRGTANDVLQAGREQVDPNRLASYRLAKQLDTQWEKRIANARNRVKKLETEVRSIHDAVKQAQGDAFKRIEVYSRASVRVRDVLTEAQKVKAELSQWPDRARGDFADLDAARKRDLENVEQKLKLVKLDGHAIAEEMLGPELTQRLGEALGLVNQTREVLDKADEVKHPERGRGLTIEFPRRHELPKFLVQNLTLSGRARVGDELMPFKGNAAGITSQPALYGKPTIIQLAGHGRASLQVNVSLDHTGDVPVHTVSVDYEIPVQSDPVSAEPVSLVQHGSESGVYSGSTHWKADFHITGNELTGQLRFHQDPVEQLTAGLLPKSDKPLETALNDVLANLDSLEANLDVSGPISQPKVSVTSNLGPAVADGVNNYLASEISAKRDMLAERVNSLALEQSASLSKMLSENYKGLFAKLNVTEETARDMVQRVAGRPLDLSGLLRR